VVPCHSARSATPIATISAAQPACPGQPARAEQREPRSGVP
jgi:hypothetical protein